MPQSFPFTPSTRSAPTFMPTLDGVQHNCTVTWNLQAQRYYLNVFTLQGARVLSIAIVDSPAAVAVASIAFDPVQGLATLTTAVPHRVRLGRTVRRTVAGCAPSDYAGSHLMFAASRTALCYRLPTIPLRPATAPGTLSAPANLVEGYFASTLVFRAGQFEVAP